MKKAIYILILLSSPLWLMAQGHGIQIAPRGGATTWRSSDVKTTWAPQGGLDLGYTIRWRVMPSVQLGLRTGLGATYSSSRLEASVSNQFDRVDMYGLTVQYTTTANATEQHRQLGVDLPMLFSLQAGGFALNMGPKMLWLAMDNSKQTVNEAHVYAYYPIAGVTVVDADPTGRLQTPFTQTVKGCLPKLNVLLSAELGYEWQLNNHYSQKKEQYIGIQLYMDYGLWSWHQPSQDVVLSVTPSTAEGKTPQITMGSILSPASALNYLSAGIRLYYTFQSVDYSGYGWHRYRR